MTRLPRVVAILVAACAPAVPFTFSLGGNYGPGVVAAGSPTSQPVACTSDAAVGAGDQTATAGASGLTYDATSQSYTDVWKTDKAWPNSCRLLTLTLADGTQHTAIFQFAK